MKLQNSGEEELANKLIDGADVFINKVPAVTVEENNTGIYFILPKVCFNRDTLELSIFWVFPANPGVQTNFYS